MSVAEICVVINLWTVYTFDRYQGNIHQLRWRLGILVGSTQNLTVNKSSQCVIGSGSNGSRDHIKLVMD